MVTQLQAVYENGVLRPFQPLALAEQQCVTITISDDADSTRFALSSENWEAFCELLDRPPRVLPALRELLTQPSVLDDNQPAP